MLTTDDLQAIKSIIKIEVNPIAKELKDVKNNVTDIQKDLKDVKKDVVIVQKDLKDVGSRVRKIDKNVNVAIDMFNEDDVRLEKRVVKIENHLGLPSKN